MKPMHPDDLNKIIALRHALHARPDLSGQEEGTMALLRAFLRENTALELVDREGWFYAVRRAEAPLAPPIAFRADMDALPMDEGIALPYGSRRAGAAHKCGHDGHMAALCGLALALDRAAAERTVYLIFQPAEETGQGAIRCAELIDEAGITEIYAFHNLGGWPENAVVYRRGLTQPASEGLTIRLTGRRSHASAPEAGRNPAAAIAALALCAGRLTDAPHEGMALCTVVGMGCGADDFGISAGEGHLSVTLRAEQEAFMKAMEARLLNEARALARRDGLQLAHELRDPFPETRNHDAALDRALKVAAALGLTTIEMDRLWRASEDFGHYLKRCPGAMFYIGTGIDRPALHTDGYDFNDAILETAVAMFEALARE